MEILSKHPNICRTVRVFDFILNLILLFISKEIPHDGEDMELDDDIDPRDLPKLTDEEKRERDRICLEVCRRHWREDAEASRRTRRWIEAGCPPRPATLRDTDTPPGPDG